LLGFFSAFAAWLCSTAFAAFTSSAHASKNTHTSATMITIHRFTLQNYNKIFIYTNLD
jgi:hypothetical protein